MSLLRLMRFRKQYTVCIIRLHFGFNCVYVTVVQYFMFYIHLVIGKAAALVLKKNTDRHVEVRSRHYCFLTGRPPVSSRICTGGSEKGIHCCKLQVL